MNSHERRDNSIPTLEMLDSIQAFQRVLPLKDGKVLYLPMLHVLYYRQIGPYGERGIGAACLEFGFFAWGENRQSAEECLEPLVLSYFRRRIENKEFREILNDVSDDFMEPYWALYRQFSILHASFDVPAPYTAIIEELRRISEELKQKEGAVDDLNTALIGTESALKAILVENSMLRKQHKIEDKTVIGIPDLFAADNTISL